MLVFKGPALFLVNVISNKIKKSASRIKGVGLWKQPFQNFGDFPIFELTFYILHFSIKQPTRCTINLIFIVLLRRHRSTCFGQCCAHHQEPPTTAFAAPGCRMIAGLDVLQAVVGLCWERCLRDKTINIRLIMHLIGCFIEYLKMHGTTNPKLIFYNFVRHNQTTLHLLASGWYFITTPGSCKWETDSHNGNEKHSNEIWWCWAYTCAALGLRDGGRNSKTKKSKDRHSSEQFHISLEENWQWIRQQHAEFPTRVYQTPF
jgi:hypothetical protein